MKATSTGTHPCTFILCPLAPPTVDPVIGCSNLQGGYLPADSALACTCSASLGQPQGRLLVYRDDVLTVTGNYGDGEVEFGDPSASPGDDGVVYRCVLDWATADSQDRKETFTLQVACESDIHSTQ